MECFIQMRDHVRLGEKQVSEIYSTDKNPKVSQNMMQ